MPFRRFVETGRVALVADGPYKGKLVSIIDVIDQTRVLVDGPESGVPRGALRLNQLQLTNFRIRFPFTAPTSIVRKAWTKYNINDKWAKSAWSKKLVAKEKRQTLTDFDRFKLGKARTIRNKMCTRVFNRLKNVAAENGTLYGKHKMSKAQRAKYLKKGEGKPKPKSDKKQAKPKKQVKAK